MRALSHETFKIKKFKPMTNWQKNSSLTINRFKDLITWDFGWEVYRDQDLRIRRWRGHNQGRNSKLDQDTIYEGQTKIRSYIKYILITLIMIKNV